MSSLWAKICEINLPIIISLVIFDLEYIITRPIQSFREIMGIKAKLPSNV